MKFSPLLIAVLLFVFTTLSVAQLPSKNGKVFYEQIDSSLIGKTKAEIHKSSKLWMVNAFKNYQKVIQLDNPEDGIIIAKGNFPFTIKTMGIATSNRCDFTLNITSKDGKYRIQVYDFIVATGTSRTEYPLEQLNEKPDKNINRKYLDEVDKNVKQIIQDIQISMVKKEHSDTF